MFERFSERARQVVVLAQDEARALRHGYIGTEHVLLGLLREEQGLAAGVLRSLGVELEQARAQVGRTVGAGDQDVATGQIPFTPRAKKVLELSLREAIALGHPYIGTEHVLLGLVREDSGAASRVLLDFGADAERVRNEVIRALSGAPPAGDLPGAGPAGDPPRPLTRSTSPLEAPAPTGAAPPQGRSLPLLAVAVGWFGFGAAVGIGLLLGWLIWG